MAFFDHVARNARDVVPQLNYQRRQLEFGDDGAAIGGRRLKHATFGEQQFPAVEHGGEVMRF
ncbi:hypothetical protein R3Q59_41770 [Rhodococcus jostii]|uniref:Uncharacterized protein n=1 Tax=Rhodococcus jostii TaxID=132919 RepID=A0ABU4CV76_RHOJO|nr:hypothetical protein [Rhodococcus jostii]MDV6287002.1 hypothetical protein [Rhodococcus jostii]